jgi:hypothetical protein
MTGDGETPVPDLRVVNGHRPTRMALHLRRQAANRVRVKAGLPQLEPVTRGNCEWCGGWGVQDGQAPCVWCEGSGDA